jgi:4-hydroxymandelate oxidase
MTKKRARLGCRESLRQFGGFLAGSPVASELVNPAYAQDGLPAIRLAPVEEIVAAPEFEQMAELALRPEMFETIRRGDRASFDKMTFRQRLMVYAMDLDLTTELFGHAMFAPIVVGPVGHQGTLHEEGELATARGAAAAQTSMVATRHSSFPIEEIAAETDQPLWYQVYAELDLAPVREDVARAVAAGCQVLCVTVGVSSAGAPVRIDWGAIEQFALNAGVPVVVKGIMNLDDAHTAVDRGAQGLVVSNHGDAVGLGGVAPVDVLPTIVDAIGDRVRVLVDGGFTRGSDILKGLALGATAVMLARPMMWALAAYGAPGVETALRLLINELARNMAASGRPTIGMIDRELVRFDTR